MIISVDVIVDDFSVPVNFALTTQMNQFKVTNNYSPERWTLFPFTVMLKSYGQTLEDVNWRIVNYAG